MTKITGDFCNHRKANNDNNNSTFIFCFSKCIRCVQRVCKLFSFFPFMQISSSKALKLLLLSNSIWPLLVYSYMLLLLVCLYRLMKIISTISPICFKWQIVKVSESEKFLRPLINLMWEYFCPLLISPPLSMFSILRRLLIFLGDINSSTVIYGDYHCVTKVFTCIFAFFTHVI